MGKLIFNAEINSSYKKQTKIFSERQNYKEYHIKTSRIKTLY